MFLYIHGILLDDMKEICLTLQEIITWKILNSSKKCSGVTMIT